MAIVRRPFRPASGNGRPGWVSRDATSCTKLACTSIRKGGACRPNLARHVLVITVRENVFIACPYVLKNLHATVVAVAYENPVRPVHGQPRRRVKRARTIPRLAESQEESTLLVENLNGGQVGIHDVEQLCACRERQPRRPLKPAGLLDRACRTPVRRQQENLLQRAVGNGDIPVTHRHTNPLSLHSTGILYRRTDRLP